MDVSKQFGVLSKNTSTRKYHMPPSGATQPFLRQQSNEKCKGLFNYFCAVFLLAGPEICLWLGF